MERKHKLSLSNLNDTIEDENIPNSATEIHSEVSSTTTNISQSHAYTLEYDQIPSDCSEVEVFLEEEKKGKNKYFLIFFGLFFTFLAIIFYNKNTRKLLPLNNESKIQEECELLRKEILELKNQPENIALLEKGCKIDYEFTSFPYTFGLFNLKSLDPYNLISNNSKCYAFNGSSGVILLKLPNKYKITKIGIFHPQTSNVSSAVKDFKFGEVEFSFEPKNTICFYDVNLVSDKAEFNIVSNWGNTKYTCIYRIMVFGVVVS